MPLQFSGLICFKTEYETYLIFICILPQLGNYSIYYFDLSRKQLNLFVAHPENTRITL